MRPTVLTLAGLAAVAAFPATAASRATLRLGTPLEADASLGQTSAAALDWDGDGRTDVALASWWEDEVALLVQGAGGSFQPETRVTLSAGAHVKRVVAGPLDLAAGDELVVSHVVGAVVDFPSRHGGAAVRSAAPDGLPAETEVPVLADWDADGDLDVVTASSRSRVRVRRNDGTGRFDAAETVAHPLPGAPAFVDLVAADLDDDGDVDLALTVVDAVEVLWQEPGGVLARGPRLAFVPPAEGTTGIVAAHLDGDAVLDLAALAARPVTRETELHVFLGDGSSGFGGAVTSATGGFAIDSALVAADLDGDAAAELVTSTGALVHRGSGAFDLVPTPRVGRSVALADVTGDARPDVVFGYGWGAGGAMVFPVETEAPAPYVASVAPETLFVGGARVVDVRGSGFAEDAALDFGPGTTTEMLATGPTLLRARVAVADPLPPDAAAGPRLGRVAQADGEAAFRFRVAEGGRASVTSLWPDRAYASSGADVAFEGAGFLGGAAADFGPGIDVLATWIDASGRLFARVAVAADAPRGPRDVTILNGSGLATTVEGAFSVLGPRSLRVFPRGGGRYVASGLRPGRGSLVLRGAFAFGDTSPDHAALPDREGARIRVGSADNLVTFDFPAGERWRMGRRAVWTSPPGATPRMRLVLGPLGGFRLDVRRADLPAQRDLVQFLELTLGEESGAGSALWEPRNRWTLVLR